MHKNRIKWKENQDNSRGAIDIEKECISLSERERERREPEVNDVRSEARRSQNPQFAKLERVKEELDCSLCSEYHTETKS